MENREKDLIIAGLYLLTKDHGYLDVIKDLGGKPKLDELIKLKLKVDTII